MTDIGIWNSPVIFLKTFLWNMANRKVHSNIFVVKRTDQEHIEKDKTIT